MDQKPCPFCEIVAGRRKAEIVYQDAETVVFLDQYRQPAVGGHLLIIPRQHHQDIWSLPDSLCGPLMKMTKLVATAARDVLPCTGVRVWIANGRSGGQEVFHLHIHVFPARSRWDQYKLVLKKVLLGDRPAPDAELAEMAEPIRLRLQELLDSPAKEG